MTEDKKGGFLISQIKQISGRIFEKILSEKNIEEFNGAQGRILYVLWQEDSIAIKELSNKTGLALTTLTSMLDRMEKMDLIKRTFDKTDRRKILIILTEKAISLKDVYYEVSEKMSEIFYNKFSKEEINQFEDYLDRILINLNEFK
ncbi:MAG: MarR family transcriptional regulator [Fusobacteriaceae bacterium]|jgi:MarR family transcriptional regulator, organic hydroperoxide resistance regulator|nr:MarR family transcriptional regulator [Fusobacteriaceae bacterium]MBP6468774.1 MarR family transcriptional regulator [Fusobacteriaceae bacterium]MBP9597401.1 MarR family transcriptional regulator [Fusobacteriaceae bacterium]MBU9919292.1 MarR family transcriptional regulator [Fusobacteriaceae bacterium]